MTLKRCPILPAILGSVSPERLLLAVFKQNASLISWRWSKRSGHTVFFFNKPSVFSPDCNFLLVEGVLDLKLWFVKF